jgi:hypothetical protein
MVASSTVFTFHLTTQIAEPVIPNPVHGGKDFKLIKKTPAVVRLENAIWLGNNRLSSTGSENLIRAGRGGGGLGSGCSRVASDRVSANS